MLSAPEGLTEDVLAAAFARSWGVDAVSMTYRPVGFGSHHWEVSDSAGSRWFATIDELANNRHSLTESLDKAFDRLRAALITAVDLRGSGHSFVVAPIPTHDGQPLVRLTEGFGAALYPFVEGQSFDWGEFADPAHRHAVLDLLVAVHGAPLAGVRHAMADDFAVPHRDELEAALEGAGDVAACGPYAHAVSSLLAEHAASIRSRLAQYDEFVAAERARPSQPVLTHGEPHPGNTMLTSAGWLLIDWDTTLIAPPERDLWDLDPGDGSIHAAYTDATGRPPRQSMLDLYRIRWDLADIAVDVARFRRQHVGNLDDDETFAQLRSLVAGVRG